MNKYTIYFLTPSGKKVYTWAGGTRFSVRPDDAQAYTHPDSESHLTQIKLIFEDRFQNGGFAKMQILTGITDVACLEWHIVEHKEYELAH